MSINPPTATIPPTVPPAIAPPLKELPFSELGGLVLVAAAAAAVVVVAESGVVFVVDAVVVLVEVVEVVEVVVVELGDPELELVVAEVVTGIRPLFEINPSVEAAPRINPVERLPLSSQHEPFPQQ